MGFWKKTSWKQKRMGIEAARVVQRDSAAIQRKTNAVESGLEALTRIGMAYASNPKIKKATWVYLRQKGVKRSLKDFLDSSYKLRASLWRQSRNQESHFAISSAEEADLLRDLSKLTALLPALRKKWRQWETET
ncbi:MAG: hypothetical protein Q8N60_01750 [Candidatus Diapherotrites archaeon]|nr:hypothetical protein [Candidatus Diapherotrites archaeon]